MKRRIPSSCQSFVEVVQDLQTYDAAEEQHTYKTDYGRKHGGVRCWGVSSGGKIAAWKHFSILETGDGSRF